MGEYGVLLTEMGSTEDLVTPIKPYPRIKVRSAICVFLFKFSINMQLKMSSLAGHKNECEKVSSIDRSLGIDFKVSL